MLVVCQSILMTISVLRNVGKKDLVRVSVLSVNEEFSEADYKKFNFSMCQFMDSVELNMY